MTVNELYNQTKMIMFEKPTSKVYDPYVIPNTNRVIYELFEMNNNYRMFHGKKPLKSVPYIEAMDDEIMLEDVYANLVMPLGLARLFFIDDDLSKYNLYNTDYLNEQIKHNCVVSESIREKCHC